MLGKKRVAVLGAGLTLFRRNLKQTGRELAYEATKMALDSAGLTLNDIEQVPLSLVSMPRTPLIGNQFKNTYFT